MHQDYKAVAFFDLDGTLLNDQSTLDQEVIETIQELKENQVLPIICTGRTNCEITEIQKEAKIDSAITLNGQRIEIEGEVIYQHHFPKEEVQRFVAFAKEHQDEVGFYTADEIYLSGVNQAVEDCFEILHSPMPEVNANFPEEKEISMMLIFRDEDPVDDEYRNTFPEFEFYRNGLKAMDIVARGQSKGTAIQIAKKALDLRDIPTFGFGDGTNDFSMFAQVDYPVAMGNAVEALKEQAIYITKKNTEGGIRHALKHFHLI